MWVFLLPNRMYLYLKIKREPFFFFQVISEEHETKPINFKEIPDSNKDLAEVNSIIDGDDKIAINDITVWIDPLDATQEYTGKGCKM